MTAASLAPAAIHTALAAVRTVHGTPVFTSPDGPVVLVCFHAGRELALARQVLATLHDLAVPAIAIATDGAADLGRVHEVAGLLAAPALSDPYGTLRARLGLGSASGVHLAADQGTLARFDLHQATRRALFAVLFDSAWRHAPAAAK